MEITLYAPARGLIKEPQPLITATINGDGGGLTWHTESRVATYPHTISAPELASWASAVAAALSTRIQNTRDH